MSHAALRGLLLGVLVALPHQGLGQTTVDGTAEVSAARSETRSTAQRHTDSMFGHNYALGWHSSLWDPRLVRYDLQGMFRTSSLSASTTGERSQDGRAGDLGYKVGAQLLSASALPLFFQMSRTRSNSVGDLGPGNPLRSGLLVASGAPPADFESLSRELTLGWRLALAALPRVELGYRQGQSVIRGGQYSATQRDRDLSGSVSKNTKATRQSLRYQATGSENVLEQTFAQRLGLLDYDFGAATTAHTRLTLHAGRRTSYAKSVFAAPVAASDEVYTPATSAGASAAEYGQVGYDYQPTGRFSLRAHGSVDRQTGDLARTSAALGTLSSHYQVVRGLTLIANGTAGQRQQVIANEPVTVATRSAAGTASYQASGRWLSGGGTATRGVGVNRTPTGQVGSTDAASGELHLSTTVRWFGAGTGYERSQYHDDLLDFGNYESERVRASVQAQTPRASLTTTAEQMRLARGRESTFARNLQRTVSATASMRLAGQSFVSATGGHFTNEFEGAAGVGVDRSLFWSVGVDGTPVSSLHVSAWLRSEVASATRTQFDQDALSAFVRAEYRMRMLNLAVEYRRSESRMRYPGMTGPDLFAGRQLRFSVIRQFGAVLR